jgi:hypothetical protein
MAISLTVAVGTLVLLGLAVFIFVLKQAKSLDGSPKPDPNQR